MRRLIIVVTACLLTLPALCEPTPKYQVALVTEVKPHDASGDNASGPMRYDVSVKVGDTVYVVLYTQPLGEIPAKYEVGRELLVLVGKDTITYNDVLGRSLQVPIESRRKASESKHPK